jgi:phosphoserine phosphatase
MTVPPRLLASTSASADLPLVVGPAISTALMLVATLISNPASPALDDAVIDIARALLPQPGKPHWLAKGVAADVPFAGDQVAGDLTDSRALAESLRKALAGRPVDVTVQPADGRRKKLFLADMDSTMIGQECVDELADFAGLKAHVSAITERAMRGEIAFEPALRERVALLKGLPVTVVDEVLKSRIHLTPGGRELVGTMRAHGAYACLVSGGFTLFTNVIAAQIGFDENRANTLLTSAGILSGGVAEPILGRDGKKATLVDLCARLKLKPSETLAVGDGANDLDMLRESGLGVAYHAKPAVAAAAAARIDHGDLTALLYAQGYRRDEFVTPRE